MTIYPYGVTYKPSVVTRSSEVIWLPAWRSADGNPIKTSDNKLPIMPLMEPVAVAVFHIFKFKPYSHAQFRYEINGINADPWAGWGQWQAWISKIITNGIEVRGDDTGEMVHYVVRCIDRPYGWNVEYPDIAYQSSSHSDVSLITKITKREINFSAIYGLN